MRIAALSYILAMSCTAAFGEAPRVKKMSMMVLNGDCTKFSVQGIDRKSDCANHIFNTEFFGSRGGFYFQTNDGLSVAFSGLGNKQVRPDENTSVTPIDSIIMGTGGKADTINAVGFCRFKNPYQGPAPVDCVAETALGLFEGSFVTDGKEPAVKKF